jgi:RNA polymerase sigma factor (TIGR02999 family)
VPSLNGYHDMADQNPTWSQALAEFRRGGGRAVLDQLLPGVYRELCAIAHRQLMVVPSGGSLQTSELVHEAYLKFAGQQGAEWQDRAHFFALASVAMRHILVDRAKARTALKRGGTRRNITLDEDVIAVADQAEALLDINEALDGLAETDARLARVVECRFFGGMSEEEIAEALGVTVRTVQRDWAKARMLLRRALE